MKYSTDQIIDVIVHIMNYLNEIGYDDAYDNLPFIKEILRHYWHSSLNEAPIDWGMNDSEYITLMSLIQSKLF